MSTTELMGLILEVGLPPREERERVLAQRLAENGENPAYGPGNPDWEHDRARDEPELGGQHP